MRQGYGETVEQFLFDTPEKIVGKLTLGAASSGFYSQQHTQTEAWKTTVEILKNVLTSRPEFREWFVVLEFTIPRRGKRVDMILLAQDLIFVIEFKIGAAAFLRNDIAQVEDYALDLRDFHLESQGRTLVPVLVASEANRNQISFAAPRNKVAPVQLTNVQQLAQILWGAFQAYHQAARAEITPYNWVTSAYQPTPTIIEAAQILYADQNVREISRYHAGADNLGATSQAVLAAVEQARGTNRKLICFITGVPGAGKTLAGLNIVHNPALHNGKLGVFLSGNGPLVKVLSEALARDYAARNGVPRQAARREVSTFIQNVHRFLDAYFYNEEPPVDRVIIFDEAQRAWNAEQSERKFNRSFSEPEMMLEIVNRHKDWAVIVALIGGGQEINSGEAGLPEWGRTLAEKYPEWKIMISPQLLDGDHSTGGQGLFAKVPDGLDIQKHPALHLEVSLRAYRAEWLSEFVASLLADQPDHSRKIFQQHLQEYPIFLTRDIQRAKRWLKSEQRGLRRVGIIASSGARRIKPFGYDVRAPIDVANWFLNPPDDVRSSYFLEEAATEFDIQGLELDWTCVGWGGDFRHKNGGGWEYRKFRGTIWQRVNDKQTMEYIKNKYRVLLTRAREGFVIWVPAGDRDDPTREPAVYDATAEYLIRCGIPLLDGF